MYTCAGRSYIFINANMSGRDIEREGERERPLKVDDCRAFVRPSYPCLLCISSARSAAVVFRFD